MAKIYRSVASLPNRSGGSPFARVIQNWTGQSNDKPTTGNNILLAGRQTEWPSRSYLSISKVNECQNHWLVNAWKHKQTHINDAVFFYFVPLVRIKIANSCWVTGRLKLTGEPQLTSESRRGELSLFRTNKIRILGHDSDLQGAKTASQMVRLSHNYTFRYFSEFNLHWSKAFW